MNNPNWVHLKHLILVPGHAIYTGESFENPFADNNWYLQSFQHNEPPYYIEHIRAGVELAATHHETLVIFSGGQTRREAGPRSEAQGYWLVANHFKWWDREEVMHRATSEEFARDSFENLLFSICRFYECVGAYPEKITIVGWKFKAARFDMHREALQWSDEHSRYEYLGVNNPANLEDSEKGELYNAREPFRLDPYGTGAKPFVFKNANGRETECNLGQKRIERNPFHRTPPYCISNPLIKDLLVYKGDTLFDGKLPWTKHSGMEK